MDIKSSFLHGYLTGEVYMEQPLGFVTDPSSVCQLKKSLYGWKQTPCARYENIDQFFVNLIFKLCEYDHSVYVLHVHGDTLIVALYVNDSFIIGNNVNLTLKLKKQLVDTFEMTDILMLHFFFAHSNFTNE